MYVSFSFVAVATVPIILNNIVKIFCAHVDSLASKFYSLDLNPNISSPQINNSFVFTSFHFFAFRKEKQQFYKNITNIKSCDVTVIPCQE